ncbi:hypothetical protein D3C76_884850 [compost metagenome]
MPPRGVEPHSPQCVVDQKLHHIAWGKKLVPYCQLAAVARCLTGITHGFAFFFGVEVLVDPANGFVCGPERLYFKVVELNQQRTQGGFAWEQQAIGGIAVEQGGQLLCQFIKHAEKINLVSLAGFTQGGTGDLAVELVATRLIAFADRLD